MHTAAKYRRRSLIARLQHVLDENEAIDRALEPFGEALGEEDAMAPVLNLLSGQLQRPTHRHRQHPAA